MNAGRTVFAQIMALLPLKHFHRCVERYNGDHKVQSFSCLDQFLTLAFAQLTYRESLRDIESCLRAVQPRLYHMGFRCSRISRNTLAHANEHRDWRIYADFAQVLIAEARALYSGEELDIVLDQSVCAGFHGDRSMPLFVSVGSSSTLQSWCQSSYAAGYAGQYSRLPAYHGSSHQRRKRTGSSAPGGRRHLRHGPWIRPFQTPLWLAQAAVFFVVRARANMQFRRRYSHPVDRSTGLRSDQTVILTGQDSAHDYPAPARRVHYFDAEHQKDLIFLTNHFALPALSVAHLYKSRWKIELFFKWIKQHLRIKAFFGTSANAVKIQIWTAVSVYLLIAILRKRLDIRADLYRILQVISITVFEKTPILQAFQSIDSQLPALDTSNQLILFD